MHNIVQAPAPRIKAAGMVPLMFVRSVLNEKFKTKNLSSRVLPVEQPVPERMRIERGGCHADPQRRSDSDPSGRYLFIRFNPDGAGDAVSYTHANRYTLAD